MDIDLSVLRLMEREKRDPVRRTRSDHRAGHPDGLPEAHHPASTATRTRSGPVRTSTARPVTCRVRARARRGGQRHRRGEDSPSDFGRIAAFAAKQVINQRLRDMATTPCSASSADARATSSPASSSRVRTRAWCTSTSARSRRSCRPKSRCRARSTRTAQRIRVYVTSVSEGAEGSVDHGDAARTPASCASCSRSRSPRSRAASSRSCRSPARPATAPRSRCGPPSPASTRRAPASASSASASARSPPSSATRRSTSSTGTKTSRRSSRTPSRPAKVTSAFVVDETTRAVRALVPDYQLSLAIGKEGQNARLAAKLTGAKIDIQPDSVMESRADARVDAGPGRSRLEGVTWNPSEPAWVADSVPPILTS